MDMSGMSGMDMGTTSSTQSSSASTSSMVMNMVTTAITSTMSSMSSMNMSSSSAATSSSSSMSMYMNASAITSASATQTSSTATSDSSMDMSDDDSTMVMPMYMSTKYLNVPVFFKTLDAHSSGAAFGIFCVLFFACFAFRGLIFLSSYLEQKVYHNYANTIIIEEDCACDDQKSPVDVNAPTANSFGQVLKQLFWPGLNETFKDICRLVLAFSIAMFGYVIMLAAMSFVVLYFFAICLGLAFAEVFYNRLSIILGINKNNAACAAFH